MKLQSGWLSHGNGAIAVRNGLRRMGGPGFVGLQFAFRHFHCFIVFHWR